MTVNSAFTYSPNKNTGVVIVVFAGEQNADAVIECTTTVSASVPISFVEVGRIKNVEDAGSPFVHLLPLDNQVRYYQVKHVEDGLEDSAYIGPVSATPTLLPDDLSFSNKPWLSSGDLSLELLMTVTGETTGTLIVSSSINRDPAEQGTPTVSVQSYTSNIASVVQSGSWWVIQKPTNANSGEVVFQNALSSRHSDIDNVTVIPVDSAAASSSFLVLDLTEVSASITTVTIKGIGTDPLGGTMTIQTSSYYNVSAPTYQGQNSWLINRPPVGGGVGSVSFKVTSTSNAIPDFNEYTIGQYGQIPIYTLARVTSSNSQSIGVELETKAPFSPSGTFNPTINVSSGSQSPAGLTVTGLGNTLSSNGSTITRYNITRPNTGAGTGRVVFSVSSSGYLSDQDSVEVPERVDGLATLITKAQITSMNTGSLIVSVSCIDPLSQVAPSISMSTHPGTSNISIVGSNPYTITRQSVGDNVQVRWTGTAAGRNPDADSVDVGPNRYYMPTTKVFTSESANRGYLELWS